MELGQLQRAATGQLDSGHFRLLAMRQDQQDDCEDRDSAFSLDEANTSRDAVEDEDEDEEQDDDDYDQEYEEDEKSDAEEVVEADGETEAEAEVDQELQGEVANESANSNLQTDLECRWSKRIKRSHGDIDGNDILRPLERQQETTTSNQLVGHFGLANNTPAAARPNCADPMTEDKMSSSAESLGGISTRIEMQVAQNESHSKCTLHKSDLEDESAKTELRASRAPLGIDSTPSSDRCATLNLPSMASVGHESISTNGRQSNEGTTQMIDLRESNHQPVDTRTLATHEQDARVRIYSSSSDSFSPSSFGVSNCNNNNNTTTTTNNNNNFIAVNTPENSQQLEQQASRAPSAQLSVARPRQATQLQHQHQPQSQPQAHQNLQNQQADQRYPSHNQNQNQNQHQIQTNQRREYPLNHPLGNTKHLCSICGDRATGKHYGVFSCEGCKGFFKRTIRKDIVYACRSNGVCIIDMRQRNRCQHCRYQKCLRQGMKREAVQEEKQRLKMRAAELTSQTITGYTNCDSRVESTSNSQTNHNINMQVDTSQTSQNQANLLQAHNQPYNHLSNLNGVNLNQLSPTSFERISLSSLARSSPCFDPVAQLHQNHKSLHSPPASVTTTTTAITGYHAPLINSPQSVYHPQQHASYRTVREFGGVHAYQGNAEISSSSNSYTMPALNAADYHQPHKYARIDELTLRWAAQMQIEQLIDWAKSVPNFTELLIDDQVTLLKSYWNELIISDVAFKSVEALKENLLSGSGKDTPRLLCIGRGLYINMEQAQEVGLGNMFGRILGELVDKMLDMRMDANELACLRAIILFNPETHGLKTSQPIEEYRGNVYTALESYCRKNYENQPNRFGKLLMRLPALRSIGLKCDSTRLCDNSNSHLLVSGGDSRSTSAASIGLTSLTTGTTSPSGSSNSSSSSGVSSSATANSSPPAGSTTMLGYQVKLLFFDICYQVSTIDSFLRSSLMH